jgi:hypothetical protein
VYGKKHLVLVVLATFALTDAALLAKYVSDAVVVRAAVDVPDHLTPSQKVVALVDFLETSVPKTATIDRSFLPGFDALRPTARQVLEHGGDCADRSRLLIVLLRHEGIYATKVALHDSQGSPQHAVVSASIEDEDQSMVIDALFGMYFPKPDDGYYSVWELQRDETIVRERVRELGAHDAFIRGYPLEQYSYVAPKSINWSKSYAMSALYQVLHAIIGDTVDRLPRPAILSEPVLVALVGLVSVQAALIMGAAWVGRRQRPGRRAPCVHAVANHG